MRQSERDRVLAEFAALRDELKATSSLLITILERLEVQSRSMDRFFSELDPWVTLAEVCDMQHVPIETAVEDCYYLPGFGTMPSSQGWPRDTVRAWIATIEAHRHEWALMHRDKKRVYRERLRQEVSAYAGN